MTSVDAAVARHAARQHGLVTSWQAADAGASRGAVRHRVTTGRWVRAGNGVYRIAGAPVTWESTVLAHVLSAGPGAMASHRTAAVLWQLDGVRPGAPEVSIGPARYRRPGAASRLHRSLDLHLVRPVLRSGIPTTPVSRTLLDLGAVAPRGVLHLAVDDARRRQLVDWGDLIDVLVAHARQGRRGAGPLRALIERHGDEVAATDSGFERLVIAHLGAAGLPAPVLQHEVALGGHRYRIDLSYPDQRVAIELDGGVHLRRHVWEADHVRQNAFVLAGWTVLRFTWADYRHRRSALADEVRLALAAAAA